jgi:hypothetical protein
MPSRSAETNSVPGPAVKRRKIRKGTQSCWRCKRQKSRCEFLQSDDDACIACRKRGVQCTRQDEPEQPLPGGREDILARLIHVEAQLKELLEIRRQPRSTPESPPNYQPQRSSDCQELQSLCNGDNIDNVAQIHATAFEDLINVWPNGAECRLILTIPHKIQKSAARLVEKCTGTTFEVSLDDVLRLPPAATPPALLAKRLLTLAIVLQGAVLQGLNRVPASQRVFEQVMLRVMQVSSRLFAIDHSLLQTVEGVQCMALESMYYNNAGRLRNAWLIIRRAIAAAQLIATDKGPRAYGSTAADSSSGLASSNRDIWLSLVQSDQYLSMMLGLSDGVSFLTQIPSTALEAFDSFQRLEYIHSAAANLILQRYSGQTDASFDKAKIDAMIKSAADCMPASWWRSADAVALAGFDNDTSAQANDAAYIETDRIMKHLIHYHLLTQLHLPYFLGPSDNPGTVYSRITAINASRDLLTRYVTFRNASTQSLWYCRGIDLLAFIASVVICLGHILSNTFTPSSSGCDFLSFLSHQRLTDRGLLESVLETMRMISEGREDKMALKIVSILQPLLVVESKAAVGIQFELCFSNTDTEEPSIDTQHSIEQISSLRIHVPCSGVLRISPRSLSDIHSTPVAQTLDILNTSVPPNDQSAFSDLQDSELELQVSPNGFNIDLNDWALEGVDSAFFSSLLNDTNHDIEPAGGR